MLKIEVEDPVIVQRYDGCLDQVEATHHYCTVGRTPDGTIITFYGMHPDIHRPPTAWVPVELPESTYPSYKFRLREAHPDYRWPYSGAFSRSEDRGRTWSEPAMTEGLEHGAVAVGGKTLVAYAFVFLAEPGLGVCSFRESDDNGLTWRDRPGFFHYPPELELLVNENRVAGAKFIMHLENQPFWWGWAAPYVMAADHVGWGPAPPSNWRDLVICPGVPRYYPVRRLQPIRNEGKTHMTNANVSPWLATLPNGVVAMVYGRPGVHITFSEDGTGTEWRDRIPLVPEPSLFGVNCHSSHMAGVIDVGENELLIVYDVYNYQPPDGGPPGNTVFALRMRVEKG